MNKKRNNKKQFTPIDKLTSIHNLIVDGSESIDILKQNLLDEYQPNSTTEYMVIAQIIDTFTRLNRLQSHVKNKVTLNIQKVFNELIESELRVYGFQVTKQLSGLNIAPEDYGDYDATFYDWTKHNELLNIKRNELEKKYNIEEVLGDDSLQYLISDRNIRDEENHLISNLLKYIDFLDNRIREKQEKKIKMELIKLQIKQNQQYDYD